MTSLLTPPTRSAEEIRADLAHRRPLVLTATLGGIAAAAATLVVCLAVGVVGWFLTDAGAHGTPSEALRTGALGWLSAHFSGVHVRGTLVSAVPLGLTLVCAWTLWRTGLRVGDSISGHGPDIHRIGDGERDLTVPLATLLFTTGYAVSTVLVVALAGTATTQPSDARAALTAALLSACVGGTGIAVGSGRAAVWVSLVPAVARAGIATARAIVLGWLLVSTVALVAALALDLSTAANLLSQLGTDAGGGVLYSALTLLVLPNAVAFSGSYLLGPGFAVGAGTLVSPTAVMVGPLPMFPLLAALPDGGDTPAWTPWLVLLGPLTAALAVVLVQRRLPVLRWEEAIVRALSGGVLAALAFTMLASLAGGAVGPGRMREVGPSSFDVLVHALTCFGVGAVTAAAAMTWWQRRTLLAEEPGEGTGV